MQKTFKADVIKSWMASLAQEMADLEEDVRQMCHLPPDQLFARVGELEQRSATLRKELDRLHDLLATED